MLDGLNLRDFFILSPHCCINLERRFLVPVAMFLRRHRLLQISCMWFCSDYLKEIPLGFIATSIEYIRWLVIQTSISFVVDCTKLRNWELRNRLACLVVVITFAPEYGRSWKHLVIFGSTSVLAPSTLIPRSAGAYFAFASHLPPTKFLVKLTHLHLTGLNLPLCL